MRVKLALIGLLAVASAALSGCTNDPQQAIAMSGFTLTEDQVERDAKRVDADVQASREEARKAGQQVEDTPIVGRARELVVQFSAFNEVAGRYAKQRQVSVPAPDRASVAQTNGLPENDPFVGLAAQAQAYASSLTETATPAGPTEQDVADLKKAYQAAATQYGQAGQMSDADLAKLFDDQEVRRALGLRNALLEIAERDGLVVSPRYSPLAIQLSSVQTDLGPISVATLPLGDQGTGAVRDVT